MSDSPKARLTARSILLGLLLIPPNCYWIIQMERVRKGPYVTSISLFANALSCWSSRLINAASPGVAEGIQPLRSCWSPTRWSPRFRPVPAWISCRC